MTYLRNPMTVAIVAIGLIVAASGSAAHASLVGDSVNANLVTGSGFDVSDQFNPTAAVVGAGVEFEGAYDAFGDIVAVSLDFDADSFTVTFLSDAQTYLIDGGGIQVSDLDWISPGPGELIDVVADSNNPGGINISQITVDSFFMSIGTIAGPIDLQANVPSVHQFDLITTHIPEPGSLALLGLGGLMVARRRR